ncbi:MAG: YbjN domain-containing protein [Anaerolineales bacterium]|nr:YbjN domain-containing protein [Anaerolineales bacterium]
MVNLAAWFKRYEWGYVEVEGGVFRATFATETDDEFDLFVFVEDDWVHLAVSPLLTAASMVEPGALLPILLRLNQRLTAARFALDSDGDVNLLADLPVAGATYAAFAQILDLLTEYVGRLVGELRRAAGNPGYQSPLFS